MDDTANHEATMELKAMADITDGSHLTVGLLLDGDIGENHQHTSDNEAGETEHDHTPGTDVVSAKTRNGLSAFTIYKNLVIVGLSFAFLFTAFKSLSSLQSTLNRSEGLGTICLAIIYSLMVLTGLLLPTLMLSKIGTKWTMAISMTAYLGYIAADFKATWATKIPTSIVLGVFAVPLWTSQMVYVVELAKRHAAATHIQLEHITSHFFGIFYAMYFTSNVFGNVISSLVFKKQSTTDTADNTSLLVTEQCGAEFCPMVESVNVTSLPDFSKVHTYISFCLGCGVVGVATAALFVDNITSSDPVRTLRECVRGVLRHVRSSTYQKLLIPCTMYRGLCMAFIEAELTAAYTSCTYGVQNVGLVMVCFGSSSAVFSVVFGKLSKYSGHFILFVLAYLTHLTLSLVLLLHEFGQNELYIVYVVAAAWGMGDAIVQPITTAMYSRFFKKDSDAAFSCFRVLESLGYVMSFAYSSALCTRAKIYVLFAWLLLSICTLTVLEIIDRRSKQHTSRENLGRVNTHTLKSEL